MSHICRIASLVCLTGLTATTLFAQGAKNPAASQAKNQYWLKYEKELGLQPNYSVDMEIQAMGMSMKAKMYRKDGKTRSDMTLPFMNLMMVALELPENGKLVHYSVFPSKKKYVINPEEPGDAAAAADKGSYKLEDAGTEAYNGVTCKKSIMTVTQPDGSTSVMTLLQSPAQKNMPVKIDSTTKVPAQNNGEAMDVTATLLFTNYSFEAPGAALFVIPKDYTQAANMAEVMMGGGAAGAPSAGGLSPEAAAALRQALQSKDTATPDDTQQKIQALRSLMGK